MTTDEFHAGEYTIAIGNDPTGVPSNGKVTGLSVYPNPASESLTIELSGVYDSKTTIGYLYDATGKLVRNFAIPSARHELNTKDLPSGLYILKVTDGKQNNVSTTVSVVNNR